MSQRQPLDPIIDWLDSQLEVFVEYLVPPAFNAILKKLWELISSSISEIAATSATGALHTQFFPNCEDVEALANTVSLIRAFFHAGGVGLAESELSKLSTKIVK